MGLWQKSKRNGTVGFRSPTDTICPKGAGFPSVFRLRQERKTELDENARAPEDLPSVAVLPDLFRCIDGSEVSTPAQWERRREELRAAAQYYAFGFVKTPEFIAFRRDPDEAHCTLIMRHEGREATFSVSVHRPGAPNQGPAGAASPAFIWIGRASDRQRAELLRRGYAVIEMPPRDVYSDDASRGGAYTTLFPYRAGDPEYDSGALRGWGWGVSRILDVLEQGAYPDVDPARTLVTGVSRFGKAALLAAAFDQRVGIAMPVDSGQAGTSLFRYHVEGRLYHYVGNPFPEGMGRSEKISNMMGGLAHWFSSRMAAFVDREDRLPFDAHAIMALVAPRPLLIFAGEEWDWLCPPATVLAYAGARELYEFLGAGDAIGIHVRKGPHAILDQDIAIALDFADHIFRGADLRLSRERFPHVDTYETTVYQPDSAMLPWSRPGKHTLWTDQEQFLADRPATLVVHTDASTVTLTPPSAGLRPQDPVIVPVSDGIAVIALTAEQARAGTHMLRAEGAQDSRTIAVTAVRWDDAFRTAVTVDGSAHIIHFTDRYDKATVRVLVNGKDLTDAVDPEHMPDEMHRRVYLMHYGIRIVGLFDLPPDADGAYRVEVRRLRFRNFLPHLGLRLAFTVHAERRDEVPSVFTSGLSTGLVAECAT